MKSATNITIKIYKYLFILFSIVFWIYLIIDDYGFIEKYWSTNWLNYIGAWLMYYVVYSLVFSVYYWLAAAVLLLFYYILIKGRTSRKKR